MPLYTFQCSTCEVQFDYSQSMHDDPLDICPECTSEGTLSKVLYPPTVFDATPRTVGSMAERNSGPGRQYWLEAQRQEHSQSRIRAENEMALGTKPEKPWWRDGKINPKLNDLSPQQKASYVITGDSRG